MKRLRLISTLVILSVCFSLHAEIVSGTCGANGGDNLTWTLNTESGLLKIEGSGEMNLVPWFDYNNIISQVDLPFGLINIQGGAFMGCTKLTSITIPSSVTTIGGSAFHDCTGLISVSLPSSVTTIEKYAFSYCTGLTSVTIPSSVTTMEEFAFSGCTGLTSVAIPSSVTTIGDGIFFGCSSLKDIIVVNDVFVHMPKNYCGNYTIPSNINRIIGHAFTGCTGLVSVAIPNSVTTIRMDTFSGCTSLTSIDIPNSVISIGECAFSECTSLTSINIPNSVISIGNYAFQECESLTSINIPNSVTSIGNYTFYNCTGLTSVIIPNSVTRMGYGAFMGCSGIKSLYINTPIDPGILAWGIPAEELNIEELYIGDDVTVVYDYFNFYRLRKVVLGKKVSQIRAQAFSNAKIQEFTITGEEPPYCYPNIFGTQDLSAATLYVPASKAEYYQTTEPWTKFGTVKTLEGDAPVIPTACEKPAIAFENGKLLFTCGTNGAKYHCTITSPDMKNNELNESGVVDLEACYDIYVYATADGCTQSETATAKLYWVKDDGSLSGINQVERRGIVVSSDNGFVNVSGLNDGEQVTLYSTEGKLLGTQSAQGGACIFTTFEKVVFVKIGDSSFKVLVK